MTGTLGSVMDGCFCFGKRIDFFDRGVKFPHVEKWEALSQHGLYGFTAGLLVLRTHPKTTECECLDDAISITACPTAELAAFYTTQSPGSSETKSFSIRNAVKGLTDDVETQVALATLLVGIADFFISS